MFFNRFRFLIKGSIDFGEPPGFVDTLNTWWKMWGIYSFELLPSQAALLFFIVYLLVSIFT